MKKNNPKVTIVIPVYNGKKYIKEAIDSALNQTYENTEIIVINDGSEDNTEIIIKKYKNKIKYFKKENGGVSSALNLAIRKMTGEYFAWLSHDDIYYPNKIKDMLNYIVNNNLSLNDIYYCDYDLIDRDGKYIKSIKINTYYANLKSEYSLLRAYINGIAMLIPKKAFEICGFFDESLKCTQDYEMWNRMIKKYNFMHIPLTLTATRIHAIQETNTNPLVKTEGNKLWIKMIEDIPDKRKIELEGSVYAYYRSMANHLTKTPYSIAKDYCEDKVKKLHHNCKDVKVVIITNSKMNSKNYKSILETNYDKKEIIFSDNLFDKNLIEKTDCEYIAFLKNGYCFTKDKLKVQLNEMLLCNKKISHTSYKYKDYIIDNGFYNGNISDNLTRDFNLELSTIIVEKSFLLKHLELFKNNDFFDIFKEEEILGINIPLVICDKLNLKTIPNVLENKNNIFNLFKKGIISLKEAGIKKTLGRIIMKYKK